MIINSDFENYYFNFHSECSSYKPHELDHTFRDNKSLNVFHINIRSLNKNADELKLYL